jgi:hypothetical protein
MTSQNVWNMSLFEHFVKVLSLYLEARIRIRIKVKDRIRIRIKETSRIRIQIRIKVIRIRNTCIRTKVASVTTAVARETENHVA